MNTIPRWPLLLVLMALPVAAQRLPKTVIPTHYEIAFEPNLAANTFLGTETIELSVQQPIREIVLHATELEFQEASIDAGPAPQAAAVSFNAEDQTATLRFSDEIPIGPARLRIRYQGLFNQELRGLYLGTANGRKYAATQMEAADARRAFPCFDEPELKATFAITAIVDERDKAISNGAVVWDRPGPRPGKRTVRFATTPRMSTYLVALVVGDFACLEGGSDGVPMRVCATPDKVGLGKLALEMSEKYVAWFQEYFGVRYAFGKIDHIGISDFSAGAMENSGAIIYRDIYLLVDERASSLKTRQFLAFIVSHELAHMWFGDLVTMRWWDDLWLNEGFANWISYKPIQAAYPSWDMVVKSVEDISLPINADSLQNTRPIQIDVETVEQADELFDAITYEKAAAVLSMVESLIGEQAFREGVSAYLRQHSFGNATADDFSAALSDAAPDFPVDRVLDSFVKQPGVPVLMANSSCVNGRTLIQVRQKRFFVDARLASRETNDLWHIPVCTRAAGSDKEVCKVMKDRKQTFRVDGCGSPVFLNARGKGYYITAVADRDLEKLRASLGGLSDSEKVALVRDEWMLVRSTRRPVTEYLKLAEAAMKSESRAAVVTQLLSSLSKIDRWLPAGPRAEYREWLGDQLGPLLDELGWQPSLGESLDRTQLRAELIQALGVTARHTEVIDQARRRTLQYFENPASLDPSLVQAVLNAAAVEGDERLFNLAVGQLERAGTPEDRTRVLEMLGQFRERRLMKRLLERALLPDVRMTEARTYLGNVLKSAEGADLGWRFLTERWSEVTRKIPPSQAQGLVRATSDFCDPRKAEEVKRFFGENPVPAAERALAQALESINLCVQTTRFQAPKLAAWLAQREQVASQ